jgi:hypothetical protein
MLQLALIVALLCVIPCFLGICIIYMQVLTIKAAVSRCEVLSKEATDKTLAIDARVSDLDQPSFVKVQTALVEVEAKAEKAYLKAENVMESLSALINRMNVREREVLRKQKREEKEVERGDEEREEPELLQYNLLNGGLDRMPNGKVASGQVQTAPKRKFGQAPIPQRAIGV